MDGANALIRRTFAAAARTLGIASQLAAWPMTHVVSAAEATALVNALRQALGCNSAGVFAESDGRFAIFRTWVSANALLHFRALHTTATLTYSRLEV